MRLPDFSDVRVLVCGDDIRDITITCRVKKLSAEAPIPVFEKIKRKELIGATGYVFDLINSISNSDKNNVVLAGNVESLKVRYKDESGRQVFRCDEDHLLGDDERDSFLTRFWEMVEPTYPVNRFKPQVVVLCDYDKGAFKQDTIKAIIEYCRKNNIKTIVDTKYPLVYDFYCPDVIKFNKRDYDWVGSGHEPGGYTVVTDGENGCTLITDEDEISIPAYKSNVKDVTGAGDAVTAMLACCLAKGINPKDSCVLAMQAASVAVENDGCYVVSRHDLKDQFECIDHPESKLVDKNELKNYCDHHLSRGKKVAITNGCFDVLHHGHMRLLAEAYNAGDKLVVAINSDDSIKRLKGANRPINSFDQRVKQLCNMPIVDRVILFDEDTPEKLYSLLPEALVLVKGVEKEGEYVVGESRFKEVVKVVRDPGEPSTTSIIEGCSKQSESAKLIDFVKLLGNTINKENIFKMFGVCGK